MDIAVIQPDLSEYGGANKYIIECLFRWQKKHDLTIYTTKYDEKILDGKTLNANVKIIKPYTYAYSFITLAFQITKLTKQIGEHEIYNSNYFPTNLIDKHPSVGCPQEPPRMIYDLKDDLMKRNDIPLYYKLAFRTVAPLIKYKTKKDHCVDKLVANSNYAKNYLEEVFNQKVDSVIYPGIDYNEFAESRKETQKDMKMILSVSRLYPEKRIDLAIMAMNYLPEYKLVIVGKGPDEERLKDLSKKLNIENRVHIVGSLNENELKNIYAKAFCTIFTPLREPFGIIALESLASGTPIIGINEGGFTEIIHDYEEGFLVPSDSKVISEKIRMLEDKNLYENMCKKCIKTAKYYTWDKTAKELLEVLKRTSNELN